MGKYTLGALFIILLFVAVIMSILAHEAPPYSFELAFSLWVQSIDFPGFSNLMVFLTRIGLRPAVPIIVVVTAMILFILRFRLVAFFVLLTATGDALDLLLKDIIARPRPTPDLVRVYEFSPDFGFPSGHAVHAVVFWGFLIYLAWSLLKAPILKYSTVIVLLLIILLTGLSRIYLGAHWLGDVVGGYVIGLDWLIMLIVVYQYVEVRWGRQLEYFLGGSS